MIAFLGPSDFYLLSFGFTEQIFQLINYPGLSQWLLLLKKKILFSLPLT